MDGSVIGKMDRRIVIQRSTSTEDGFGGPVLTWATLATVWAQFWPVSDGEKWRAGMVESREIARFTIRYSSLVAGVTSRDRISFGGTWGITGVKEIGRREYLEITAEKAA